MSAPRSRCTLLAAGLLLAAGSTSCALLGASEPAAEPEERDQLDVVDDRGPFDPSEAVDDARGLGEELVQAAPETPGEDVARPDEVDERGAERRAALAAANDTDDEGARKQALADNPDAAERDLAEPWTRTARQLAFEALLLVGLAGLGTLLVLALRGAVRLVRAHPVVGAVATTLLVVGVASLVL